MEIGFIGLGSGMVRSLLRAGQHRVGVHNRDMAKAAPLVKAGAVAAASIKEAVAGEVVMYCLSDDAAIETVVLASGGVADEVTAGQLVIDLSTITPNVGLRERAAIEVKGADFLDAPVFGTRGGRTRADCGSSSEGRSRRSSGRSPC